MTYVSADLRRLTIERAGDCCEYCRLSQQDDDVTFHIEHIIAVFHGGRTEARNLALSCVRCNLYKGSNIAAADPETGDPTFLFHPRRHLWHEHFSLDMATATIQPLTPEGRATVFVLRMNSEEQLTLRQLLMSIGRYPCSQSDT